MSSDIPVMLIGLAIAFSAIAVVTPFRPFNGRLTAFVSLVVSLIVFATLAPRMGFEEEDVVSRSLLRPMALPDGAAAPQAP
ncbi:hypothetical protein [Sagittula stellata]|nr:hypothetical protein [Sagittula stellata]